MTLRLGLHDELVSARRRPAQPLGGWLRRLIRRLGLEVFWLAAGDPALKGSRALFDEQSGSVCCEAVDDPGERALLVAHEIGHARVHAASSSCGATISIRRAPPRPRLSAYNVLKITASASAVNSRQMFSPVNFYFPAHLRAGSISMKASGASAIADRTGLPKNLVRQQIFDALLLPTPPVA